MILFNGATGGLGSYLGAAIERAGLPGTALRARLEDRQALGDELASVAAPKGGRVHLLQLAARVSVPACEADPAGTMKLNVDDTRETVAAFVQWARARSLDPAVVYVSSGHVYGPRPDGRLDEAAPTAPRSVYARSKLEAEMALGALSDALGFPLVVARVFGLIAPRQPPNYVLPGLIRRVRSGDLAAVPGLDFTRDYLDARDVCDDLVALSRLEPRAGTELLNVCSGEGVTLRRMVELIVRTLRPDEAPALLGGVGAAPGRPDDVPSIVGDPTRFLERTGRSPKSIPLEQTIRDACASA